MGKYRHVVSGRVVERDDAYARRSKAFEPVPEDTPLSDEPCIPCGVSNSSAGVEDNEAVEVQDYGLDFDGEEPTDHYEEK